MKKILLFLFFIMSLSHVAFAKKTNFPNTPRKTIVLDAGHGGLDLGTKANAPYCEEKRVALRTVLLTKKYLDQLGYHVILTRTSDTFIPLPMRVQRANLSRCALFVSLHYNSSPNQEAHGIEIFYCDEEKRKIRSNKSKNLATKVLRSVIWKTKARSRGVKKGNFFVIRQTKMPAILLEGGFISNPKERRKLKNGRYIDRIARGLANGIDKYCKAS